MIFLEFIRCAAYTWTQQRFFPSLLIGADVELRVRKSTSTGLRLCV